VGFKNLTKYVFTYYEIMWFGNVLNSLGADVRKDVSQYINVGFLGVHLNVNRTPIGAFSVVYMFRSDRLDTMVLFHSVL